MGNPLRILLVDDDGVDRLAVKRLLKQTRFDIVADERSDRAGALAAIGPEAYDCVLVDYNLPGTDGVEVLSELRAKGATVPVIALTGQGDEEVAVALMKAGAVDYLNKNSLTAERLEGSLRFALAMQRAEVERRELLEREQHARQEAQEANRTKDEFLATLSHELRTPLNAILGWSRLLSSGALDEETARRAVEIIDRNTRLQAQLIEDLLDISRIITGKLCLDLQVTPVGHIIERALESARSPADAKRVNIEHVLTGPHEAILCDPTRMQQVVWNLLTNAVKFTPEGGTVRVDARREGSTVVISVTDNGIGIAPDFLPHVFDRFRQEDGASTRQHGGLGLGLSIVRHVAELHGGSVEASSAGENCGAVFYVRMPVAPVSVVEMTPADPETAPETAFPSLAGIAVLVVDNEADTRALVRAVLERCGARVDEADGVPEALAQIEKHVPDVLLSDIAMPGEDGYSLIRHVRGLDGPGRLLPSAAFTAFATPTDRARALLAGYQAHVTKPVEPSTLAAVVASLARRSVLKT
ncbi:MAG TPA: response regulator [Vicinamibacterales bacterium]|nr:response regulator [Vicinamibacterales bacterium]